MASDPIPIVRDHKKLGDELDDVYIEAVNASMLARGYLKHRKGNPTEIFFQFYYPFGALFQHTRFLREMKGVDDDLVGKIDAWFQIEGKPRPSVMTSGLDLFSRYQEHLLQKGIIILKRE